MANSTHGWLVDKGLAALLTEIRLKAPLNPGISVLYEK